MPELTLADLLAEVQKLGGDPATTRFTVWGQPIELGDDWDINRVSGALVVNFTWASDEDGWEALDDDDDE